MCESLQDRSESSLTTNVPFTQLVCSSGAGMCPWKVDVWMLRGEREHEGQRLSAVWWCRVRNGSHVHPDALATPSPGLHPPPRPSASLSCPSPRLQFSPPMASPSQPCALPSTALSPSPPSPPRATRFGPCRQALAAAGANSGKTGDHAAPTAPPPFFPRLPSPPSRGPQQER